MANLTADQLVRRIHDRSIRLVLAVTGGGSGAVSALLSEPGASRTIVEAVVPYSAEAMSDWLGAAPEHYCSPRTARAMAMAAFRRALHYEPQATNIAGIACTASLVSDRPKRGPHRIHLAMQLAEVTACQSLILDKGRRDRREEERLAESLILNLIAEASGLPERLAIDLAESEHLKQERIAAPRPWQDLLAGRVERVRSGPESAGAKHIIFPGAFNPLHVGHRRMAEVASQMLADKVAFELSILNVDKPPLDYIEIDTRLRQFGEGKTVWLTRAPTFVQKAMLFPGATFVVGADTIERIADPHYYGGLPDGATQAIETLCEQGCRFLVFGRRVGDTFKTLENLRLPASLAELCQQVPESMFREDLSSTELRRQANA